MFESFGIVTEKKTGFGDSFKSPKSGWPHARRYPFGRPSLPDAFHGPDQFRALATSSVVTSGMGLAIHLRLSLGVGCSSGVMLGKNLSARTFALSSFVTAVSPASVTRSGSWGCSVVVWLRNLPQDASFHKSLPFSVADAAVSLHTRVPSSCNVLRCIRRASRNSLADASAPRRL